MRFVRNARAKHLTIRLRPFDGIRVTVPSGVTFESARLSLLEKRDWLERNLQKMRIVEAQRRLPKVDPHAACTRRHSILAQPSNTAGVKIRVGDGRIHIRYPAGESVYSESVQSAVREGMKAAYRIEAKEYLPKRLEFLSQRHGFKYHKVFIKDHKSRWGSCSARNNINLSLHLMRLPDELVDYVILHELVHTEIKDHSARFWQRLAEVCPEAPALRKRLRHNERSHSCP